MEPSAFGRWIKRLRAEQDLTQEMLAEAVGCATPTLRSFEIGKRRPSRDMAERIADVLQVPTSQQTEFLRLARLPLEAQRDQAEDEETDVLAWLAPRQLLLVLDNFEQLLGNGDAVAWVAELFQHTPGLHLLITSRERLRLRGERIFELGGLALPADAVAPEKADAVQFFLERAQQAAGDFRLDATNQPAVVRICKLLDGMPLGIELAAAWVRVLSVTEIADEIEKNMDFLALADRDAMPRHRSMRAVFDHSWRLLSDEERAVLMKLAVFRGRCLREAAAAVADATLLVLAGLIDKSLVRRMGDRRFDLHELIRQFAAQQLAAEAQTVATKDRHLHYFHQFALQAEAGMSQPDQVIWYEKVDQEQDNLRAAWAFAEQNDPNRHASRRGWNWSPRSIAFGRDGVI